MAVNINVPSQVRTFANLAAFPASGAVKTIYIAEDTNKTYRWTGSVYVEISASGSTAGFVPYTGATDDVDLGTHTLSAKNLIVNHPSGSGVAVSITKGGSGEALTITKTSGSGNAMSVTGGNVEFGTGFFWDNTNGALQTTTTADNIFALRLKSTTGQAKFKPYLNPSYGFLIESKNAADSALLPMSLSSSKLLLLDGNVIINGTSDSGFKLDVNGTARVQNDLSVSRNHNGTTGITLANTTSGTASASQITLQSTSSGFVGKFSSLTSAFRIINPSDLYLLNQAAGDIAIHNDFSTGKIKFGIGTTSFAQMTLFSTGNVGINTTTDAGFKLDVNGTANIGTSTNNVKFTNSASANFIQHSTSSTYFAYLFPATNAYALASSRETYVLQSSGTIKGFRFEAATGNSTMFVNTSGGLQADQYVNIGGNRNSQNNTSAVLELESTIKGFLPPRMTTTQRNAIASPAAGLIVYDTTLNLPHFFNGTIWVSL